MFQAGDAAERSARDSERGLAVACSRGRGRVTAVECATLYLAGQEDPELAPDCARDLGCSTGRIKAQKLQTGDIMGKWGRCANPACENSKKQSSLPAKGLCGVCYKRVLAGKMEWPPKADPLTDPLEMREVQEQHETAGAPVKGVGCRQDGEGQAARAQSAIPDVSGQGNEAENVGESAGEGHGPGQDEPFEKIEGLPGEEQVSARVEVPERSYAEIHEETMKAMEKAKKQDHFAQPGNMVTAPVDDGVDLPTSIDGMVITPLPTRGLHTADPVVRLYPDRVSILAAAAQAHGLTEYTHALLAKAVKDGRTSLLVRFYDHKRAGASKLQRGGRSTRYIAHAGLGAVFPEIGAGIAGRLEPTEWERLFWVRFGGDTGEAA